MVICAGRWTSELAAGLGLPVPLVAADAPASAATAFQARTSPLPIEITGVITTSIGNFRPDIGRRLVFQAHDLDDQADPNTPVPPRLIASALRGTCTGVVSPAR